MKTISFFILMTLLSCAPNKPMTVAVSECVTACVDGYVRKYFEKIYSTQDRFYSELRQLCDAKMTNSTCVFVDSVYGGGYSVYKYGQVVEFYKP
jgi:predicted lipoprotein